MTLKLLFTALFLIVGVSGGILTTPKITTTTPAPIVGDSAYYLKVYNYINNYRAKHVSPSLRWSRFENEGAEALAVQLVRSFASKRTDPDDMEGINYFVVGGGRPSGTLVVNTWYNESSFYNYNTPGYNTQSLNFTQIIWKSSTGVGIGAATFNNFSVVVAKFSPSGNIRGQFRTNVVPPRM